MKESMVDSSMKQKHVVRLKAAMYQSYKQYQGCIPPKEVVQLALAYSTVFHLGLDQAGIQGAIYSAMDNRGMVNIDTFIQAVLDYIMPGAKCRIFSDLYICIINSVTQGCESIQILQPIIMFKWCRSGNFFFHSFNTPQHDVSKCSMSLILAMSF